MASCDIVYEAVADHGAMWRVFAEVDDIAARMRR